LHLAGDHATLYVDTSGEPLFKRGWRRGGRDARVGDGAVHGEAPLKETLAATMLAAAGWRGDAMLLDPCCGAGTIVIEAAQIASGIAPGLARGFAFERLAPWRRHLAAWRQMRRDAEAAVHAPGVPIHASDVDPAMVRIARANAERAGVAQAIEFSLADALDRQPPMAHAQASTISTPKTVLAPSRTTTGSADRALTHEQRPAASPVIVTNPPFGQRVDALGVAGGDNAVFAQQLAANWKRHYAGWTAWLLCPDPDFEKSLRLKATARVPLWNGTIECRLLRLVLERGSYREPPKAA
jgi:putative N6-adenine-specific DNA methylase